MALWEQTGRVEAFGDVLIQFAVQPAEPQGARWSSGPTHEEIITDLVSRQISSYRQMPITLYQIQTKFRNEERPRFGVLRTSEFLMKDAYSFDASVESLDESYEKMYAAYCRIFDRCGLDVSAGRGRERADRRRRQPRVHDPGRQRRRHACCTAATCGYAANQEKAEIGAARLHAAGRAAEAARARSPRPAPAPSSRSASSSSASRRR